MEKILYIDRRPCHFPPMWDRFGAQPDLLITRSKFLPPVRRLLTCIRAISWLYQRDQYSQYHFPSPWQMKFLKTIPSLVQWAGDSLPIKIYPLLPQSVEVSFLKFRQLPELRQGHILSVVLRCYPSWFRTYSHSPFAWIAAPLQSLNLIGGRPSPHTIFKYL